MKTILPWIFVLGLLAGTVALYSSNRSKDAELARLRSENQEAQSLRSELENAKKQVAAQEDQIAQLKKDTQDLLRLRNEVRQLHDEKEAAMTQAQKAEATASQAQQQLQTQTEQTRRVFETTACLNNLRLLQAAKVQWAAQNKKPPEAIPTMPELTAFLPNHAVPTCPSGGQYTLNAVNQEPTCSTPGHQLPK